AGKAGRLRLRLAGRREDVAVVRAGAHLVARGVVDEIMALADLPSASERAIGRGEAYRHAALGRGEIVLGLIKVLLGRQHGGEVARAKLVLGDRDGEGVVRRRSALSEVADLLAPLDEAGQSVFHLALRLQHDVLVVDE